MLGSLDRKILRALALALSESMLQTVVRVLRQTSGARRIFEIWLYLDALTLQLVHDGVGLL